MNICNIYIFTIYINIYITPTTDHTDLAYCHKAILVMRRMGTLDCLHDCDFTSWDCSSLYIYIYIYIIYIYYIYICSQKDRQCTLLVITNLPMTPW